MCSRQRCWQLWWHSAQIDFIEALNDADERIGLVMVKVSILKLTALAVQTLLQRT